MQSHAWALSLRLVLAAYGCGMILATHWPDIDVYAPGSVRAIPQVDKVVHAGMYLGWAVLWVWVLSAGGQGVSRRALVIIVVGGAVWAALDEWTQGFFRRDPDIWDYLCDLGGLAIGVMIGWWRWPKRQQR